MIALALAALALAGSARDGVDVVLADNSASLEEVRGVAQVTTTEASNITVLWLAADDDGQGSDVVAVRRHEAEALAVLRLAEVVGVEVARTLAARPPSTTTTVAAVVHRPAAPAGNGNRNNVVAKPRVGNVSNVSNVSSVSNKR